MNQTLEHLRGAIKGLKDAPLTDDERLRQLEIHQRQAVALYVEATKSGTLPLVHGDDDLPDGLPGWEALSRALEVCCRGKVPCVDSISDARIPLVGTDRSLHVSPPSRARTWIDHAVCVVDVLAGMMEPRPDDLIETSDAARQFQCDRHTLARLRKKGELRDYRIMAPGTSVNTKSLWSKAELAAILNPRQEK